MINPVTTIPIVKDILSNLASYNLWATVRLCDFLKTLPEEQLDKETVSSYPTIRKTLYHIWGAQQIWLMRIKGRSPEVFPTDDFKGTFQQAIDSFIFSSEKMIDVVEDADEVALQAGINYKTISGEDYSNNISEIIQHVVNHSTYHRGQLVTMLRQLGHDKLVNTDYITWCRE